MAQWVKILIEVPRSIFCLCNSTDPTSPHDLMGPSWRGAPPPRQMDHFNSQYRHRVNLSSLGRRRGWRVGGRQETLEEGGTLEVASSPGEEARKCFSVSTITVLFYNNHIHFINSAVPHPPPPSLCVGVDGLTRLAAAPSHHWNVGFPLQSSKTSGYFSVVRSSHLLTLLSSNQLWRFP